MSTADAVLDGVFSTAQYELRTKAGAVLQTLSLAQGSGAVGDVPASEFSGAVTLPSTSFLIYVTGLDGAGKAYQRVLTSAINPQTIKIVAPLGQDLQPGQATDYVFQVQNLGTADTFRVSASDDAGFINSVSATSLSLNNGQTGSVTVRLLPPLGAVLGTSETLTVTVESTSGTGVRNFAVVNSFVASLVLPFSSFSAKLEIMAGPPPGFEVNGNLTLNSGSGGINPLTDNATLQIGTFSLTIPRGSFKRNSKGAFVFEGTVSGVTLDVQIAPLGGNSFQFKAAGTGVNLTGLTNPVTVGLTIGVNTGSTTVVAEFK